MSVDACEDVKVLPRFLRGARPRRAEAPKAPKSSSPWRKPWEIEGKNVSPEGAEELGL